MKKKGKKKIILPRFAFALTPIYSLRVLSPFAQYNLVEFPNTDQYNVYYVPSNNSERKKTKAINTMIIVRSNTYLHIHF